MVHSKFSPWSVYKIHCSHIDPPKPKLCVCFTDSSNPLFFFINTELRSFIPKDDQPGILKSDHSFLDHDSYLNLGSAQIIQDINELRKAAFEGVISVDMRNTVEGILRRVVYTLSNAHHNAALESLDNLK